MDEQTQCSLLCDLPQLPLLVIWEHVHTLEQADSWAESWADSWDDSWALLATCKKALLTFGRLADRTAKLKLILRAADRAHGEKEAVRGDVSLPLKLLSQFPRAGLELAFASINSAPIQPDLLRFIDSTQTLELGNVMSLDLVIGQQPWMMQPTQPRISADDMAVVAAKFPLLQRLRLKYMDVVTGLWHEPLSRLPMLQTLSIVAGSTLPDSFLSSLSCLERLSSLDIDLTQEIGEGLGRVMQHLQHISGLASLSLNADYFYASHLKLSALSCLWGLQHLTRLSFISWNEDHDYDEIEGEAIAGLAGCQLLTSLELSWGAFEDGSAELLAAELTRLTHLSVHSMKPLGSMTALCSWKDLTLNSLYCQDLRGLVRLPLAGLHRIFFGEHIFFGQRNCTYQDCSVPMQLLSFFSKFTLEVADFEAFLGLMELRAPQLAAAMLRANTRLQHSFDLMKLPGHALQETSAALRLIAALKPLGPCMESLTLPDSMAVHVVQLIEALPGLTCFREYFGGMILSRKPK